MMFRTRTRLVVFTQPTHLLGVDRLEKAAAIRELVAERQPFLLDQSLKRERKTVITTEHSASEIWISFRTRTQSTHTRVLRFCVVNSGINRPVAPCSGFRKASQTS